MLIPRCEFFVEMSALGRKGVHMLDFLIIVVRLLREHLKPVVKTEEQYILVCHVVGPFLQRFHAERTRCLLDVSIVYI